MVLCLKKNFYIHILHWPLQTIITIFFFLFIYAWFMARLVICKWMKGMNPYIAITFFLNILIKLLWYNKRLYNYIYIFPVSLSCLNPHFLTNIVSEVSVLPRMLPFHYMRRLWQDPLQNPPKHSLAYTLSFINMHVKDIILPMTSAWKINSRINRLYLLATISDYLQYHYLLDVPNS